MTLSIDKPIRGWLRILIFILPCFITLIIFQFAGLYAAGINPFEPVSDNLGSADSLIGSIFTMAGIFLIVWLFQKYIDREPFSQVGFSVENAGKDVTIGITTGLIIMAGGFGVLLLMHETQIKAIDFNFNELLLNLALFATVAVAEELLVRGYILKNLMLSMNRFLALLISSVLFAVLHIANPYFSLITFLVILLSGIILGISYIYTKSLWFPIALHFSWNFFQGTIFGFNVSGQDNYSLIQQYRSTDNFMNGGKFGFEGSLLAVLFLLAAIPVIRQIYDNRTKDRELV